MYRVPKNAQCDPRITCAVSIDGKGCKSENKMSDITNAWKPEQVRTNIYNLYNKN